MKLPRSFYQPLAAGAPEPLRELPVRLERMIHFVPPHNEKVTAKVPELVRQVDVVLGNLEDAIPADAKTAARAGFIAMAKAVDFGAERSHLGLECLQAAGRGRRRRPARFVARHARQVCRGAPADARSSGQVRPEIGEDASPGVLGCRLVEAEAARGR